MKLIKAQNLQEYVDLVESKEEQEDVEEERYMDVWNMTEEQMSKLNINPDDIYRNAVWDIENKENF